MRANDVAGNGGLLCHSSDHTRVPVSWVWTALTMQSIQSLLLVAIATLAGSTLPAQLQNAGGGGRTATTTVPEGLTKGEWSSIRAAYEAGRHAVSSVEGLYQARNPRTAVDHAL